MALPREDDEAALSPPAQGAGYAYANELVTLHTRLRFESPSGCGRRPALENEPGVPTVLGE